MSLIQDFVSESETNLPDPFNVRTIFSLFFICFYQRKKEEVSQSLNSVWQ